MYHEYYDYSPEKLLEAPKIPMEILEDDESVYRALADEMVELIREKRGAPCVLICPVGPVGQYPFFVKRVNEEGVSLRNCWFINMDEYLDDNKQWIDVGHPLSFRGFMERTVYSQINPALNVPEEQRVFPDPKDVEYIPRLIDRLGGVDACFGGIGINGHLAFNEADASLSCEEFKRLKTRVLPIAPETRAANAIGDFGGRLEDMPSWCVTVGFHEIYNARKIRLGVFRAWHRAVVRRCGYGDMTAAFPVSMLAEHPDALIRMTKFVANLEG